MPTADAVQAAQGSGVSCAEMIAQRGYLVRFAQRRLHDPVLAEDVVHDVFEAVLGGRAKFAGRSTLRCWLTSILKHKIVDLVRSRAAFVSMDHDNDSEGVLAIECQQPRPDEVAEQRERLALTLQRIDRLPMGLRDVIEWRVMRDRSTAEVCERLAITEDNLFVRLHRARKQLAS